MADTELASAKLDELTVRLEHVKQIEEERIGALENLKQELEQREQESNEDEEDDEQQSRMLHAGQALVEQLDKRIKAMQREVLEKKRSQELRKRQLLDEREDLIQQITAEVEVMKVQVVTPAAAAASRASTAHTSGWRSAGLTVVLCGAALGLTCAWLANEPSLLLLHSKFRAVALS